MQFRAIWCGGWLALLGHQSFSQRTVYRLTARPGIIGPRALFSYSILVDSRESNEVNCPGNIDSELAMNYVVKAFECHPSSFRLSASILVPDRSPARRFRLSDCCVGGAAAPGYTRGQDSAGGCQCSGSGGCCRRPVDADFRRPWPGPLPLSPLTATAI